MDMNQFEALSAEQQKALPYSEWPLDALDQRAMYYEGVWTDGKITDEEHRDWAAVMQAQYDYREGDGQPNDWDEFVPEIDYPRPYGYEAEEEQSEIPPSEEQEIQGLVEQYKHLPTKDVERRVQEYENAANRGEEITYDRWVDWAALSRVKSDRDSQDQDLYYGNIDHSNTDYIDMFDVVTPEGIKRGVEVITVEVEYDSSITEQQLWALADAAQKAAELDPRPDTVAHIADSNGWRIALWRKRGWTGDSDLPF